MFKLFIHVTIIFFWWLLYTHLKLFASYITHNCLSLSFNSNFASALEFFLYDIPKVFMLLTIIVYAVGILRTFITPEKTRKFLLGKNEFIGNVLASFLGIVTPFCSCSAIPLFIGFVSAGIPLGVTFSFLISAPMINEIALVLLYGILGWKIALIYLLTGVCIAIISGIIIGKLNPEKHVEEWVKKIRVNVDVANDTIDKISYSWQQRIDFALNSVKDILTRIWFYVVLGIAVGAFIHGYVPENFLAVIMGNNSWWSVPLATVFGVPLYSNAVGIIPIVEALLGKGVPIGTVLSFMMATIGLSLPEMLILRKVLKPKLIFTFVCIVACGIMLVGYLLNCLAIS